MWSLLPSATPKTTKESKNVFQCWKLLKKNIIHKFNYKSAQIVLIFFGFASSIWKIDEYFQN